MRGEQTLSYSHLSFGLGAGEVTASLSSCLEETGHFFWLKQSWVKSTPGSDHCSATHIRPLFGSCSCSALAGYEHPPSCANRLMEQELLNCCSLITVFQPTATAKLKPPKHSRGKVARAIRRPGGQDAWSQTLDKNVRTTPETHEYTSEMLSGNGISAKGSSFCSDNREEGLSLLFYPFSFVKENISREILRSWRSPWLVVGWLAGFVSAPRGAAP